MTKKDGFAIGILIGLLLTFFAKGYIIVIQFTEEIRIASWFFLFLVFLITQAITVYNNWREKSYLNPTADGAISGIAFIQGVLVFILYGFQL